MSTRRWAAVAATGGVLLATATGCAESGDDEVSAISADFYAAVADHDGDTACGLLSTRTRSEVERSSGKPCATGLLEEGLPAVGAAREVAVFGTSAQVRYAGEVAFLSRFHDGWRVVAAKCSAQPDDRYDCEVSGG